MQKVAEMGSKDAENEDVVGVYLVQHPYQPPESIDNHDEWKELKRRLTNEEQNQKR